MVIQKAKRRRDPKVSPHTNKYLEGWRYKGFLGSSTCAIRRKSLMLGLKVVVFGIIGSYITLHVINSETAGASLEAIYTIVFWLLNFVKDLVAFFV